MTTSNRKNPLHKHIPENVEYQKRSGLVKCPLTAAEKSLILSVLETYGFIADVPEFANIMGRPTKAIFNFLRSKEALAAQGRYIPGTRDLMRNAEIGLNPDEYHPLDQAPKDVNYGQPSNLEDLEAQTHYEEEARHFKPNQRERIKGSKSKDPNVIPEALDDEVKGYWKRPAYQNHSGKVQRDFKTADDYDYKKK